MLRSTWRTMMDSVDQAILHELQKDSRLSMRKLAERVYLTPPAVAERVRRLEARGIITGYTIVIDQEKIAPKILAFVNIFMKSNQHERFLEFVHASEVVRECYRISGDPCYLLRVETPDHAQLNAFLESILTHGNYRLNIVISSLSK